MGLLDEITNPSDNNLQNQQKSSTPGGLLGDILSAPFTKDEPKDTISTQDATPQPNITFQSQASAVPPMPPPVQPASNQDSAGAPQPPTPPKKKGSGDFGRIFGSIFFAGIIFFSAFLAYVILNPDQAQFFISLGINPQDIKNLLEKLVNYSFGLMTGVMSVVSLVFLFTAFATKKEYSKKKTIATILSILCIIFLFGIITFWAWLVQIIGATDYINPNGGVILRDNDKMKSEKFKDGLDQMFSFDNLIGPITLQYDLSADARYVSKYIDITSYAIDFDGDGKDDKTGVNAEKDLDIIYTYEKKQSYTPKGKYVGLDKVTGKEKEVEMKLPVITIVGLAKVTEKDDRQGGKRVTIDISDLKQLGKMDFYLEDASGNFGDPDNSYNGSDKYSPQKTFKSESLICMVVKNNQKEPEDCDKIFIVGSEGHNDTGGEIMLEKDPLNPLIVNLSFVPNNKNLIVSSYLWSFDDNSQEDKESVEHTFLDYGKHEIKLDIKLANGTSATVYREVNIQKPLVLSKPASDNPYDNNNSLLRVTTKDGKTVLDGTYKRDLSMYHIKAGIPVTLDFDASYVKVDERTYNLSKVEWDFNEDGKFEKAGEKINFSFLEDKKYTILIKYTFVSALRKDTQVMEEKIVVEADKKDIDVQLKVVQDNDYAPTVVHFDGSASQVKEGQIIKFTYDFGEGKSPVSGDAKQDYSYKYPGVFKVKFTVNKDDGTSQSILKTIILKEKNKDVIINTSVSSGYVGRQIDFDSAGSIGQIDNFSWDFGDGSRSSEPTPSHAYDEPGTYTIKLTLTFADGVIKYGTKTITIK